MIRPAEEVIEGFALFSGMAHSAVAPKFAGSQGPSWSMESTSASSAVSHPIPPACPPGRADTGALDIDSFRFAATTVFVDVAELRIAFGTAEPLGLHSGSEPTRVGRFRQAQRSQPGRPAFKKPGACWRRFQRPAGLGSPRISIHEPSPGTSAGISRPRREPPLRMTIFRAEGGRQPTDRSLIDAAANGADRLRQRRRIHGLEKSFIHGINYSAC